jgi:hypothetical protein
LIAQAIEVRHILHDRKLPVGSYLQGTVGSPDGFSRSKPCETISTAPQGALVVIHYGKAALADSPPSAQQFIAFRYLTPLASLPYHLPAGETGIWSRSQNNNDFGEAKNGKASDGGRCSGVSGIE